MAQSIRTPICYTFVAKTSMNTELNLKLNGRLYFIDWLRVFAFGMLFIFHCLRFFDDYPWHIKNQDHSIHANLFIGFSHSWRMHLIFLVSGVGTYFALRSRKQKFLIDRIKRLIIPFLFGMIVLIIPQKFYEAIHNGWFQGNFFDFLLNYHHWIQHNMPGFSIVWTGHIGLHLWYLPYLFIATLITYPLLLIIFNTKRDNHLLNILSTNRAGLLIILSLLIILGIIIKPQFPGFLDWGDFIKYSIFFLSGFIMAKYRMFMIQAYKYTFVFLTLGLASFICTLLVQIKYPELMSYYFNPQYNLESLFLITNESIASFSWVMFFLGLSQRIANFNHPILKAANIGILPFYMLHQTVIVIIGFYIVQLEWSIILKFLIIFSSSLIITIILYQLIKQIKILRFLFGLKNK